MASKANDNKDVSVVEKNDTVILFKVNKPLTNVEYKELEARVRQEQAKSGLKIVLAPYSVDAKIKPDAKGQSTESEK